jgi:Phage integrase, N-terminal SAM-like domain
MKANIRDSVIPQLWRDESAWKFKYRHAGRARTLTLGAFPLLTPQAARRACQVAGALVAVGRCPATERRALAAESRLAKEPVRDIVETVAARFLKHQRTRVRLSTWTETKRVFDREILPAWENRRLAQISKADVRALVAKIAARGSPVSANRCLTILKTWMNWCVAEDILTLSAAANVAAPAAEKARERGSIGFRIVGGPGGLRGPRRLWPGRQAARAYRPTSHRNFRHELERAGPCHENINVTGK